LPLYNITIKDHGAIEAPEGSTLLNVANNIAADRYPYVLAIVDQRAQDLSAPIIMDGNVEFVTIAHPEGFRAYQRSVAFLMIVAAKSVLGQKTRVVIEHSINKNLFCEICDADTTNELLQNIEQKMRDIVRRDIPIHKIALSVGEAVKIVEQFGYKDKAALLKYRRVSNVNFYMMDGYYDYFYGPMLPTTGLINNFRLIRRHPRGFVLQMPSPRNAYELAEITPNTKISEVFAESNEWARILSVDTVGALNDLICRGETGDIIRINEALHEKKIAYLADRINDEKKTIVLIAGPSSSGKTTFAQRLCIQLRVNGLKPSVINLDDYFLDRDCSPRDAEGNLDYETIEAIDGQKFNSDLSALLAGDEVEVPQFDFIIGKRAPLGRRIKLSEGDVLVVEGIHGLNEKLTEHIPRDKKFKIFVSALTQLNVDDHNRIPTTDTRLLRRIVRDNRTRGVNAAQSIGRWPSVLRGENMYIFPFQEEADGFFNSALVYEMCVLKQYAEPILFRVEKDEPEYMEARRLIKFLDSFLGVDSELVQTNSILREFIGGSCF
jgi:uridine kinase